MMAPALRQWLRSDEASTARHYAAYQRANAPILRLTPAHEIVQVGCKDNQCSPPPTDPAPKKSSP